tara:strand:+ start:40 stop:3924 length:3885 start_codon:yes stop_codon:yes gene_type:complete
MKNLFLLINFIFFSQFVASQSNRHVNLKWENNSILERNSELGSASHPNFKGVFYNKTFTTPIKIISFTSNKQIQSATISLQNAVYQNLSNIELKYVNEANLPKELKIIKSIKKSGNENIVTFQIPAFIFNPYKLKWEKRISFDYNISINNAPVSKKNIFRSGVTSPMQEGKWFKIGVTSTGVQKLDKNFFEDNKINISGINPKNIRIFGYSQGMLPESIVDFVPSNLPEIKSYFEGEGDNTFNDQDYLLFYANEANTWNYSSSLKKYSHSKHLYSDTAYFFINISTIPAQRISQSPVISGTKTHTINSYDYHSFHELDKVDLIKTGKQWYGERFDFDLKQKFIYYIPTRAINQKIHFDANMAVRSLTSSGNNMLFRANNSLVHSRYSIPKISSSYSANYASVINETDSFNISGNMLTFEIEYEQPINGAVAWLNYFEIEAKCKLEIINSYLIYSNNSSIGSSNISEYNIDNTSGSTRTWDVTNPYDIQYINTSINTTITTFKASSDSLKTFISFNSNGTKFPFYAGAIQNQNLTSLTDIDYILITPAEFKSSTQTLADYHKNNSNLTTAVVDINQIYNEFSSGTPDITAIRNFCKYLYDNANSSSTRLKYLFLMGDGSFDPKDRKLNNSNFIPTFQSDESVSPTGSFVSDDYYGMLDDKFGIYNSNSSVDIGIGRFPARNQADAASFVAKVIHYANSQETRSVSASSNMKIKSNYSDWKNKMLFVADDGSAADGYTNSHLLETEMIINTLLSEDSTFNVNKVYLDAYNKESTAGGGRYPDVNREIREAINSGVFFVSYIGHGGEVGWADERVLVVDEIQSWTNKDALPFFLTATCEFSRFDDPDRTSAGEEVILNPNGGAIAMLTTTRLVFGGLANNIGFSKEFFKQVLNEYNGSMPRLGDVVRLTKAFSPLGSYYNNRKFVLLGDPALKLAYPKYNVVTTKVNNVDISLSIDTLKALTLIKIDGEIKDKNNQLTALNGFVFPIVYDKSKTITTLDNNNTNYPVDFENRTNILFKGVASVVNGKFSFEFITPKDINYSFGKGRISYYFANDTIDGKGYNEEIIVGGSSSNTYLDENGPEIQLYMNDTNFIFGGTTTSNPSIYALIKDESGINTAGTSLGHDITAVLDEGYANPVVLNEYYTSKLDNFKSGSITYPYDGLKNGTHTLRLKLWDVNNNSTEAYTEFLVANQAELALNHVLNYPNPFTTYTNFYFEHNQPNKNIEVLVKIFTISGKLIKSISTIVNTSGNIKSEPISWDGLDDYGDKIGKGVYIYQLKIQTENGMNANKIEKLVILQ